MASRGALINPNQRLVSTGLQSEIPFSNSKLFLEQFAFVLDAVVELLQQFRNTSGFAYPAYRVLTACCSALLMLLNLA